MDRLVSDNARAVLRELVDSLKSAQNADGTANELFSAARYESALSAAHALLRESVVDRRQGPNPEDRLLDAALAVLAANDQGGDMTTAMIALRKAALPLAIGDRVPTGGPNPSTDIGDRAELPEGAMYAHDLAEQSRNDPTRSAAMERAAERADRAELIRRLRLIATDDLEKYGARQGTERWNDSDIERECLAAADALSVPPEREFDPVNDPLKIASLVVISGELTKDD